MSLLGEQAKLYISEDAIVEVDDEPDYESALAAASEVDIVASLEGNQTRDVATYRTRGEAFVINKVSKKDGRISFEIKFTPGNESFDILVDAFNQATEIAAFALDQAREVDGAQGFAGNWYVSTFSKGEPMGAFQIVNVEMVPSSYMDWYVIDV